MKLYLLIKLDGDECQPEMLTKWSRKALMGHLVRNYRVMHRDLEEHFGPPKSLKEFLGQPREYLKSEHNGYFIASSIKRAEIFFFQRE